MNSYSVSHFIRVSISRSVQVKPDNFSHGSRKCSSKAIQLMRSVQYLKFKALRGTWVVQSVKAPTLDFSSGLDLMVCELKPCLGLSAGSVEPAWDSLSPSLSASLSLSLKINK